MITIRIPQSAVTCDPSKFEECKKIILDEFKDENNIILEFISIQDDNPNDKTIYDDGEMTEEESDAIGERLNRAIILCSLMFERLK